jgi:hypothetical protein
MEYRYIAYAAGLNDVGIGRHGDELIDRRLLNLIISAATANRKRVGSQLYLKLEPMSISRSDVKMTYQDSDGDAKSSGSIARDSTSALKSVLA